MFRASEPIVRIDLQHPFDKNGTKPRAFHGTNGLTHPDTMQMTEQPVRYLDTAEFTAIDLPVETATHSGSGILLMVPKKAADLATLWERLQAPAHQDSFLALLRQQPLRKLTVFLPSFSVPVNPKSGEPQVTVREKGTEAATVTEAAMTLETIEPPAPEFRVDRPFIFAAHDSQGQLPYMGAIENLPALEAEPSFPKISRVIHKTHFETDERGIQAAAFTLPKGPGNTDK